MSVRDVTKARYKNLRTSTWSERLAFRHMIIMIQPVILIFEVAVVLGKHLSMRVKLVDRNTFAGPKG